MPTGRKAAVQQAEPLNADEAILASIWQDILDADQVGRQDDFFALGGHSLLANKVASQVERRLGVALPLDAVFDHPELGDLAATVTKLRDAATTRG